MVNLAQALRTAGVARVLGERDQGYAEATSGFDTAVAFAPDVVVVADTAADVAKTVAVAADLGERLTVSGAGHGRLADVTGGLAIATHRLTSIEVDAEAGLARIGAGATWEPVLAATTPHGLAALCGSAPGVGVPGYLLGGGLGPLARTYGFSADYVRSIDLVTPADGPLTVTVDSHPDLFWALRGGKGGFGVVTAITVELLRLANVYGGGLYFDGAEARQVLTTYADWSPGLPESTTVSIALLRLPAREGLPESIRGRTVVHVRFTSIDTPADAEHQLAPFRAVAVPLLDTIGTLPYSKIGTVHGDPVAPMPVANGSTTLASLGEDTVTALLAAVGPETSAPLSSVEIRTLGGAVARQAPIPNAVGGRSAAHLLNVYAAPNPGLGDADRLAAVRSALGSVAPWQAPTRLINFVGRGNDADDVVRSWTPAQNSRLDAVRSQHDPALAFPFGRHES
jgi:hypothetical protein